VLNLVVQTAQNTFDRAAVVVLHKLHIKAGDSCKIALIEAFEKETTVVSKYFRLKDQHFW